MFLLAALAIILLSGCVGEVETFTDTGQAIDTKVGEQFVVALGANPTTGYTWEANYDENFLELIEKKYKQEAKGELVGAGGVEYFRFKALKTGRTEVTLVYKRPWEEPNPEDLTKVFTVHIR